MYIPDYIFLDFCSLYSSELLKIKLRYYVVKSYFSSDETTEISTDAVLNPADNIVRHADPAS